MSVLIPSEDNADIFKLNAAVRALAQGQTNAAGIVSLAAGAVSTTVTRFSVGPSSVVLLTPMSANAASAIAAGAYVSKVFKQGFTITHANNAQLDRTFGYVIFS